jgi:hypothetical protein
MKEEWLYPGAVVPVDVETTAALVTEIKRLIDVVGGMVLRQGPDYERGFIDGMQKQMQSSVDKAVNAMSQRTWVGLTDEEIQTEWVLTPQHDKAEGIWFGRRLEAKLKEKNHD